MNAEAKTKIDFLLVEDELILGLTLQATLEKFGFRVIGIATNYEEALQLAYQFKPQVLLVDVKLNGARDGIDLVKEIQKTVPVKVAYLSGNSEKSITEKATGTDYLGFLTKPVTEQQLLKLLKSLSDFYFPSNVSL